MFYVLTEIIFFYCKLYTSMLLLYLYIEITYIYILRKEWILMMKKLTASICALACAVSLIVPTTEVNANAVTKNIETASVIETKTVASTTETSTLPVISKSTDEITENCLSGAGTVTDTNPVIYTINVATPVYFNGVAGSTGVNNGTVFYSL